MRTGDGRLPDLPALSRCVRGVGNPFSVRGVEAAVEGQLLRRNGHLLLRASGTGETVRLAPLSHTVQWDPRTRRERPPTLEEQSAYKALAKNENRFRRIQIVGPLLPAEKDDLPVLEVRHFLGRP